MPFLLHCLKQVNYQDILRDELKVMDATAISLCKENDLPLIVYDMNQQGALLKIIKGEKIGTIVSNNNGG